METANIIFNQLGGNKFAFMTGSKSFASTGSGLEFKIGRNSKGVTHCVITLEFNDTYKMEFIKCRGDKTTIVASEDMVYAEQLAGMFESKTGLYTRL